MPRGHVLIVDDEPDLVRGLTIRLEAAGYRVLAAGDAVDAVEAVLLDGRTWWSWTWSCPRRTGTRCWTRWARLAGAPGRR